jgi:hypothetical protein
MPAPFTPEQKKQALESKIEAKETTIVGDTGEGRTIRRKRGVLNGTESKMKINKLIEGFHLHWMNDERNRIDDALEAGYEFVKPEEVGGMSNNNVTSRNQELSKDKVRLLVGSTQEGPLFAYLMKIRQDWYDEDQGSLHEKNDTVDAAIRGGKTTTGTSTDGFYVPREGIKLSR